MPLLARQIVFAFAVLLCVPAFAADQRKSIQSAEFAEPTTRYDHGILGDAVEFGALVLDVDVCSDCKKPEKRKIIFRLAKDRVFEDLKPRLADLDGDGLNEVIVVETSLGKGASLAVYGPDGKITATPHLGRPHRWLAPVGAADFTADGKLEIAYVEKPHLTKILRLWQYSNGELRQISQLQGLTNHRIGDDFITGGIRNCGQGPEIITLDANWRIVMATRLQGNRLIAQSLAPLQSEKDLRSALNCQL